jgi:lysozyme family protein
MMADFLTSFKITNRNEGGYANNPHDKGGETYMGISRKNWPLWHGWNIIDTEKSQFGLNGINEALSQNNSLQQLVHDFYKHNFWDVNKLDWIKDQQIANNVYDFGVNSGTNRAADYLQQCVHTAIDGIIGSKTISAVNSGDAKTIYNSYNELRKMFYTRLAVGDQQQFLKSWLSRLVPYKEL